jgi:hypothetical protein
MSRLLKSLDKAHRERQNDMDSFARDESGKDPSKRQAPGYLGVSLFVLILICSLIVGGLLVLRDRLPWLPS